MTLHDAIRFEIANGNLIQPFKISDLLTDSRKVYVDPGMQEKFRVGFDFFSKQTIRTAIPNCAIDGCGKPPGKEVQKGRAAIYLRVQEGVYRLVYEPLADEIYGQYDDEQPELVSGQNSDINHGKLAENCNSNSLSIEEKMACYLINKPFQIYFKRGRFLHPTLPAVGIAQRINSYFWPDLTRNFAHNEIIVNRFSSRAAKLYSSGLANHVAIEQLFSDICKWGGVITPSAAGHVIATNINWAAHQLPTYPATMNSAWTKLYATFFPNDFVIYDSRVATAIISIAEQTLTKNEIQQFQANYRAIGQINGRGGTRPRNFQQDWPNAYRSWDAQLDANKLCKNVLNSLNRLANSSHSLRELEAILFMEGY